MRHKYKLAYSFLALSLVFLIVSLRINLTGNVVGIQSKFSYTFLISAVSFIFSILIFTSRQTLDAIIIPTGTLEADVLRAETAEKHKGDLRKGGFYVISGNLTKGSPEVMRKNQDYTIYKHLRQHGIIPGEMMVEGYSHDTLENTLYSLKKIRERMIKQGRHGPVDVGISTYHGHFKRFQDFYEKAVKKGLFEKESFRLHEIPTEESVNDKKYEASFLRKALHHFKLETMGRYKSKEGKVKHVKTSKAASMINKLRDLLR